MTPTFKGMLKQKHELGRFFLERTGVFKTFFLAEEQQKQLISKCWCTPKRWLKWQLLTRKSIKSSLFWSVGRYQLPSKEDSLNLHVGMTPKKRYFLSDSILLSLTKTPPKIQVFWEEHPFIEYIPRKISNLDHWISNTFYLPLNPPHVFGASPFLKVNPNQEKSTEIFFSTTDLMPTFTTFAGDIFFWSEKNTQSHRSPFASCRHAPPLLGLRLDGADTWRVGRLHFLENS